MSRTDRPRQSACISNRLPYFAFTTSFPSLVFRLLRLRNCECSLRFAVALDGRSVIQNTASPVSFTPKPASQRSAAREATSLGTRFPGCNGAPSSSHGLLRDVIGTHGAFANRVRVFLQAGTQMRPSLQRLRHDVSLTGVLPIPECMLGESGSRIRHVRTFLWASRRGDVGARHWCSRKRRYRIRPKRAQRALRDVPTRR